MLSEFNRNKCLDQTTSGNYFFPKRGICSYKMPIKFKNFKEWNHCGFLKNVSFYINRIEWLLVRKDMGLTLRYILHSVLSFFPDLMLVLFNFVRVFICILQPHFSRMFKSIPVSKWTSCSPPGHFCGFGIRLFILIHPLVSKISPPSRFFKRAHRCCIFWVLSCLKIWALAFILKVQLGWGSTWIISSFPCRHFSFVLALNRLLLERDLTPALFSSL